MMVYDKSITLQDLKNMNKVCMLDWVEKNILTSEKKLKSNIFRNVYKNLNSEMIYKLYFDIKETPHCIECKNSVGFKGFYEGYANYCSQKCKNSSNVNKEKTKDTIYKRYNGQHYMSSTEVQEKIKTTNLEKYGVEFVLQDKNVRIKRNDTMLKRYNSIHALQNKSCQESFQHTMSIRYGAPYTLKAPFLIEKVKKTNKEKYGVLWSLSSNLVQEKIKTTNLEKYGVECVLSYVHNTEELSEKRKIKERLTKEKNKYWIPLEDKTEFDLYRREVFLKTNKQNLSILPNFDKRGLAGVDGTYHLDHKISIFYGFTNNISTDIISNIDNLQMIPWEENIKKGSNSYSVLSH